MTWVLFVYILAIFYLWFTTAHRPVCDRWLLVDRFTLVDISRMSCSQSYKHTRKDVWLIRIVGTTPRLDSRQTSHVASQVACYPARSLFSSQLIAFNCYLTRKSSTFFVLWAGCLNQRINCWTIWFFLVTFSWIQSYLCCTTVQTSPLHKGAYCCRQHKSVHSIDLINHSTCGQVWHYQS